MPLAAAERSHPPLWRNVSFVLMWSSVAASGFGDRIVQLAAWELSGISVDGANPAAITASITFFFMLPYVLFGPMGGWIADTLPRKWIMLFCDEARAVILLVAFTITPAAAIAIPGDHQWKIYAIVFATGTMAAIFSPTKAAVIPQIVPVRQLQAANAIVLGIATIAAMIGLKVGDQIIAHQSVRGGLQYALSAFAISGAFFAFLKIRRNTRKQTERVGQIQRLMEAAGYIRRHRSLVLLILQSIAFWGAAHLFVNALGTVCVELYGFGSEVVRSKIANMQAAVGIGMLTSALWVAWINCRQESTWFALGNLFLTGLLMFVIGLNRSYTLGLGLAFAAGFFGNAAMICVATLTQSITPNYIRGRVFGVRDLLITFTAVVVNGVIWQAEGDRQWMIWTLLIAASILAIGSGLGMFVEMIRVPVPSRLAKIYFRLARAYALVWHRLRWIGREHIPTCGSAILIANHTTSLDPVLLQALCPRIIKWVMLKRHLHKWLGFLWPTIQPIALDLEKNNVKGIRQMLGALEAGHILGVFPEGGLQRKKRTLKPLQPGVGMLCLRSGAPIVPVWIEGTPQVRSMLGHFLMPSRSTVIVGRPYHPPKSMNAQQIADDAHQRLTQLGEILKAYNPCT